ncbi:Tim44 domain-containing protein, partial [Bordetella pertussis]
MSRSRFSRFCAMALVAVAGTAMVGASFDAEARRMGGGSSFGRQSTNITQQRQAVTPPAAGAGSTAGATSAARPATAAAGTAAAGT